MSARRCGSGSRTAARGWRAAMVALAAIVLAAAAATTTVHAARPPAATNSGAKLIAEGERWRPLASWVAGLFGGGAGRQSTDRQVAQEPGADEAECAAGGDVRRNALKAIREVPFIGLFEDLKDVARFEASGMTSARGRLWIVFDNLHAIGRVDEHFQFRSPDNALLGAVGGDSQFEGLTYDEQTGHFFAVEEVAEAGDSHLHPAAHEIAVDERAASYRVVRRCPIHYKLSHANKGFEGIHFFRDKKDPSRQFLLGLCEGNHCKGGRRGAERGNGRIVVTQLVANGTGGDCAWDVVKTVAIPPAAAFLDYSGMDFRGGRVAIASQEDSALFVGTFDWDALEFVESDDDRVYHFPRNEHCEMIYCNVEGVTWLDDARLIVSSDKAKSDQPYRCTAHDQSIGIFALPQ